MNLLLWWGVFACTECSRREGSEHSSYVQLYILGHLSICLSVKVFAVLVSGELLRYLRKSLLCHLVATILLYCVLISAIYAVIL